MRHLAPSWAGSVNTIPTRYPGCNLASQMLMLLCVSLMDLLANLHCEHSFGGEKKYCTCFRAVGKANVTVSLWSAQSSTVKKRLSGINRWVQ